jgi:hypothetical protein
MDIFMIGLNRVILLSNSTVSMAKFTRIFFISLIIIGASFSTFGQVNAVVFGKNRVQYKKFKWEYYQTKNFNTYFNQGGQDLAKFVLQVAEEELPGIEAFIEHSLQRRANIIIYNDFADLQQSNIGLSNEDWQSATGGTKLVNNKLVVYFNGDHANLRKQIKEGIARVLTDNILFGEDIGEIAGNQALLDLPQWLTDGYIAFAGENWSTTLDDKLKNEMLSGNYTSFYKFAYEQPDLAGHAFWYYIQEKYKKENVTYLLYLARIYKNLNRACQQVCKTTFKEVLADFMIFEEEKYYKDIAKRKPYPKGSYIESFVYNKNQDYYHFNVNPNKRNNSFAVAEFKKGVITVKLSEDFDYTTLLKYGYRSKQNQSNPYYPLMAWDPKGTRLTVVYKQQGKIKLFVYDLVTRIKYPKIDLTDQFQQIQNINYMLDSKTLLISAVKDGHTDIFTLNLENEKVTQITNDVFDNLDATFVSFPGKTGIIFSSNRPNATAISADTVLPSNNRFNIFLITNFGGKPELNQITQLSNLKYGNARYPTPYNSNHFTFISDENGVGNRYAGFFTTKADGLDTLVIIGDEILRNPSLTDIDSMLNVYKKTDVDSVAVVAISHDSAYTFPLSNYESSVVESRIAGENNQVSEVTRQSDEKILYKLKIDENTLSRRNITVPPTAYMKQVVMADKIAFSEADRYYTQPGNTDTVKNKNDIFQDEFSDEKVDSAFSAKIISQEYRSENIVLKSAKLYPYKPSKFYSDFIEASLNNNLLINPYQIYGGGAGPIQLTSNTVLNGLIKLGTSDLMEDVKIVGAFRLSSNLRDNEYYLTYQNYKRRFDWGASYYRNVIGASDPTGSIPLKLFTNIFQGNVSYPFDNIRRLSFTGGARLDKLVAVTNFFQGIYTPEYNSLDPNNPTQIYALSHAEYVYDNTLNPTQNIWNGLRYKVYFDFNADVSKEKNSTGNLSFDWGADARYYYPIYRNFIWAGRAAGAFSWGPQKTIYYFGGADNWMMFNGSNYKSDGSDRYFNTHNPPNRNVDYVFQTLALNGRGFIQNTANGNNALVLSSEFRLPVFTTLSNNPINNAFIRNFQLTQFIDLGTAWDGSITNISRPYIIYGSPPVQVVNKAGGVGPFAGGYGFGARSTLLSYFLKVDVGWQMKGFFKGAPIWYFSMGLDF